MSRFQKSKSVIVSLWVIVFLWLAVIFNLSAQTAEQSNAFSKKVTEIIVETIAWVAQVHIDINIINDLVMQFHHLTRKFAHGWIYFLLGILVIITVINTGIRRFRAYIFSMAFCFFYATMDEIHQTFVSGRGGQISDVLIDVVGSFLGMGIYWMYHLFRHNSKLH